MDWTNTEACLIRNALSEQVSMELQMKMCFIMTTEQMVRQRLSIPRYHRCMTANILISEYLYDMTNVRQGVLYNTERKFQSL